MSEGSSEGSFKKLFRLSCVRCVLGLVWFEAVGVELGSACAGEIDLVNALRVREIGMRNQARKRDHDRCGVNFCEDVLYLCSSLSAGSATCRFGSRRG